MSKHSASDGIWMLKIYCSCQQIVVFCVEIGILSERRKDALKDTRKKLANLEINYPQNSNKCQIFSYFRQLSVHSSICFHYENCIKFPLAALWKGFSVQCPWHDAR